MKLEPVASTLCWPFLVFVKDYLDTKRSAFPRFYLISDDELLSILGTSDAQAQLQSCVKDYDTKEVLHNPYSTKGAPFLR